MLTLGLDTTGKACAAALVDEGRIIAHRSEDIGRGHAERLAPLVQELIYNAGRNVGDVSRVAVCTGPGSFTGQRVALSFAKGFALPRKLPVIGLSSLEIWAREVDPEQNKLVAPISTILLGWLSQHETPQSAPATPLYSRGPDAKLPGGVSPKTQFKKIRPRK